MRSSLAPLLIVEDNDQDFEVTVGALRLANTLNPIVRCANHQEVTLYMESNAPPHGESPALILLDLNITGTDGLALLKEFRNCDWLRCSPITILTTSSNPADIKRCYANGANAYIIKPVGLERFENLIANFVRFWFDTAVLPKQI